MAKKVLRITEGDLRDIVRKSVNEIAAISLNEMNDSTLLVEMARINKNDGGIFPFNSFEVKIWSDDQNPPHFHVIKDGWNISILIESGEIHEIKTRGNKRDTYVYIVQNVKQWLSERCAILPAVTNRENAMAVWHQLH